MRRYLVGVVAALVVLAVLGGLADRTHHLFDLTSTNALTLTKQTRDVLHGVHHKVEVTAFIARTESGRSEAAALLQRYRRINRLVTFKVVDPADAPALLQRLKVDPTVDAVAASMGSHVARAPTITEQDVTSVIAQVVRNVNATLCAATGHGEPDPGGEDPTGMASAMRLLELNSYKVRSVDLLTDPRVPESCSVLLLAAPTAALGPAEDAIKTYLAGNGRAVVLADPLSTIDLSPLLAPYRLSIQRGIAVDPGPDAHMPDDPATLLVRTYSSANPMVRRLPPTQFPAAEGIAVGDVTDAGGLSAVPVIQTSDRGYLETNPDHRGFTPGEDHKGPVTLVAAADLSHVAGPEKIIRSRVAVFGDVDFATNNFIGNGGNARLFVQAVDWAALTEDLVPLNANIPAYRPLDLTSARTRYALVLSSGVVPALFLLAGAWVWALRRRR
ncbi:MAG: Gldg family protein [Actinobacteria bacterium]|nr:Gldg family protein [Actinomycetota bacterium]